MVEYILLQDKNFEFKKMVIKLTWGLFWRQDVYPLFDDFSLTSKLLIAFTRSDNFKERRVYIKYILELMK